MREAAKILLKFRLAKGHNYRQALMKLMKRGWGWRTVEEYSGWNWVPIYQRRFGISTTSTSCAAGLTPTHCIPWASYSVR